MTERVALATPLGPVTLDLAGGAVVALRWDGSGDAPESALAREAARQIAAYFAGDLRDFDLPLAPEVSAAQARLDAAMRAIPYGETRTYGELARDLGIPAQAAGKHCGANRIAILIPCHRVLGRSGLGGYSGRGGVETKVALLRLEGAAGLLI